MYEKISAPKKKSLIKERFNKRLLSQSLLYSRLRICLSHVEVFTVARLPQMSKYRPSLGFWNWNPTILQHCIVRKLIIFWSLGSFNIVRCYHITIFFKKCVAWQIASLWLVIQDYFIGWKITFQHVWGHISIQNIAFPLPKYMKDWFRIELWWFSMSLMLDMLGGRML